MKQEIPKGVFVAIIAIVVIVVGFFIVKSGGGSDPSKPLATDYQGEPGAGRKAPETPGGQ